MRTEAEILNDDSETDEEVPALPPPLNLPGLHISTFNSSPTTAVGNSTTIAGDITVASSTTLTTNFIYLSTVPLARNNTTVTRSTTVTNSAIVQAEVEALSLLQLDVPTPLSMAHCKGIDYSIFQPVLLAFLHKDNILTIFIMVIKIMH